MAPNSKDDTKRDEKDTNEVKPDIDLTADGGENGTKRKATDDAASASADEHDVKQAQDDDDDKPAADGESKEEENDDKKKPVTSSRKKPKTEGVSGPGELPPSAFGEVTDEDANRKHGILEHGHIYFTFSPRVQVEEVHTVENVAHFNILLLPSQVPNAYRQLTIGRKSLPQRHSQVEKRKDIFWGKIVDVGENVSALKERLNGREYETKTVGTRHIGPSRVAGYGTYILHSAPAPDAPQGSKNMSAVYETHLAYALEVPHELGKVQHDLRIEDEGSFTLQVKNPDAPSTNPAVRNLKSSEKPQLPKPLRALFTTRYIPANPPSLLNYSGAELLFIPSSKSVEEQIGKEAEAELLDEAKKDDVGRGTMTTAAKKENQSGDDEDDDDHDVHEAHHGSDEGHAAAQAALKQLGVEGVVKSKPLEGQWE